MDEHLSLLPPPPPLPRLLPVNPEDIGGFLFVCDHFTVLQSFTRMIFGLPQNFTDWVTRIRPGLPLFVLDTGTNLLHGVYEATSYGGVNIDPLFCPNLIRPGSVYPAQVRFRPKFTRTLPPLPRRCFELEPANTFMTRVQAELLMDLFHTNRRIATVIARRGAR